MLHRAIYESLSFDSIETWKRFISQADEKEYGWMEWQAYNFAGLVLVPSSHLHKHFEETLSIIGKDLRLAERQGLTRKDYLDYAVQAIADRICVPFDVSPEVIRRRLGKDDLISQIP